MPLLMKQDNPTRSWHLYRRLLTYVKPFSTILMVGIMANIFYTAIDAGLTYMIGTFLEKGLIHVDMDFVKKIPFILLIAIILRGLMSAVGSYCMTWVARAVVMVLRQGLFAHLIKLPADDYDQATSGQFLSKILYDVEQVAQVSADALTDSVQNIFAIIGLLTVMMIKSWQLSLMFLITIPFIGLIVNATNKRVRRLSHRVQTTMGEVTEIATESFDGYKVVRIFGGEQYEIQKFNQATKRSRSNDMKVALSKSINVCAVQSVLAIGIATIILAAIQLSTFVQVSAGAFVAITAAMLQLIKPFKTLTTLNATFQRGLAGAESVFKMLDKAAEQDQGKQLTTRAKGEIVFHNVGYAYRDGPQVLDNINLTIPAGQVVALVGHSGSGKTTIANLLPRFYEPQQGEIILDGTNTQHISLNSLREQIALVSQHVTLFNDTIANNIAYGCFDIEHDKIIEAAKLAYAHDFIMQLPQGYDTIVGENGVLLSGGQRQRIAIARAILKDAPILILDEATSALDTESERFIQAALEEVMKNRTTLVIAHRLSTIQHADKIIVLQQGKVVEDGTHAELLMAKGYYTQLQYGQIGMPIMEMALDA